MTLRWLRGLRVQLLLWTILPVAVVLIVLSLAGVFRHRQVMIDLVEQRDRSLALAEANNLARQLERRAALLAASAATVALQGSPAAAAAALDDLTPLLVDSYAGGIALFDSRGETVAVSPGASAWAQGVAARALAHRTAGGRTLPVFGEELAPGEDGPIQLVAVTAGTERVFMGALSTSSLPAMLQSEAGPGAASSAALYILDRDGRPLFSSDPTGLVMDSTALADLAPGSGEHLEAHRIHTGQGHELAVTQARIDPPGWLLVTADDLSAMDGMAMSAVEALPIALLFVAVTGLLGVSFGVANVVRPLQELSDRAARVAWGEFDAVDTPVGGVQEVDDLRITLAQMAGRIRTYQAGMRDYLTAVTQAQEEERSRLAHELHDDTVQALIALKQRAQMVQKALHAAPTPAGMPAAAELSPEAARAARRLEELVGLIDQELVALRRLIGDLRPIYLDDLGFIPALEMLVKQIGEQHELEVSLHIQGEPVRMDPDLELAAFRIVQQALRNVVAHARARSAKVETRFAEDGLTLLVKDDGQGFTPPEQPTDLARRGHFGLMGMRERAMLYGGHLSLDSAPGHGTTVSVWLPCKVARTGQVEGNGQPSMNS